MRRLAFGLTGLLLLLVGAAYAFHWIAPVPTQAMAPAEDCPQGATGAAIGGPFDLVNQDGVPVTQDDFKGRYMLVYFGFTFCPDACPTALQTMSTALEQIGDKAKDIQPVFISVDPERDDPAKMKDYVSYFYPGMVGLTGTPEQVAKAAAAYHVFYQKDQQGDDKNYLVNHTSIIYLMGRDGNYIAHFNHTDPPEKIARTLSQCID